MTGADNRVDTASAGVEPLIRSEYFEKKDVDIDDDDIIVLACLRNEIQRLPFFLSYYRSIGVNKFFIVDNGSDDGSAEYLQAQQDVAYFYTQASYKGSCAGRLWLQELADHYCTGHWCLTVDVDELFVYPGAEVLDLKELCLYLDSEGAEGVFCVFLDMFSDLPLSQTIYNVGDDFRDVCPYFEVDTYTLYPSHNPPFLNIKGGPRQELFNQQGKSNVEAGPAMRKVPLVKWRDGFSYIFSTHSHRFLHLSLLSGVILHFKFFHFFKDLVRTEAYRGDRRQVQHYERYEKKVDDDLCFYSGRSQYYRGPRDLVLLGMMSVPRRWRDAVADRLGDNGAARNVLPDPVAPEGRLTLRSISAIWPFVANPGIAQHFGLQRLQPYGDAHEFARRARRNVKVVDVKGDHILLFIPEAIQHSGVQAGLCAAAYADGKLVDTVKIDGSSSALQVYTRSLEPNIFRLQIDLASGIEESSRVNVYLFAHADTSVPASVPGGQALGRPIFDALWHRKPIEAGHQASLDGVVDFFESGTIGGWVYDKVNKTFRVPIVIYINERPASFLVPSARRQDLKQEITHPFDYPRGFRRPLPLGYFDANGEVTKSIEVFAAGRNIRLRRTPMVVTGENKLWWHAARSAWLNRPPDR